VLQAKFDAIKKRYKSKMPDYIEAQEQVNSLRAAMARQANAMLESLSNNAIVAQENAERLQKLAKDQEAVQLLKIQHEQLSRYLGPNHPKMVRLNEEISHGEKLEVARVNLRLAEEELKRIADLHAQKLVSDDKLSQAKLSVDISKAELSGDATEVARLKLRMAEEELKRTADLHAQKLVSDHDLNRAKLSLEMRTAELDNDRSTLARLKLRLAEDELKRVSDLHAQKLVSEQELSRAKFSLEMQKAELNGDKAEVARLKLEEATADLDRLAKLHEQQLVSARELDQARFKVEALQAEQRGDAVELMRVRLRQAEKEAERLRNENLARQTNYQHALKELHERQLDAATLAARERTRELSDPDQPSRVVGTRAFVRLVVGHNSLTFEGEKTTWERLPELLEKVPNRASTVLEVGVESDQFTLAQDREARARASGLSEKFGFEYLSYVGVQPLGSNSKGTLSLLREYQNLQQRMEAVEVLTRLEEGPESARVRAIRSAIAELEKQRAQIESEDLELRRSRVDRLGEPITPSRN